MFDKIDDHAKVFWYLWLMNRWLAFRLNLSGAVFAALISAVIVSSKGIDASIAGFALSFTLQYSSAMVSEYRNTCFKMELTWTRHGLYDSRSSCSDEPEVVN